MSRQSRCVLVTGAILALLGGQAALASDPAGSPYNQVQQKASHNSIDRNETIPQTLQFDPARPYQAGCRSLEFDLVLSDQYLGPDDDWANAVQHDLPYNWKDATLVDVLSILHNWHVANPGHDVITVILDLKNAPGDDALYTQKIEQIFDQTLGRETLFTPSMLQRSSPNLLDGARVYGWPTLADLRNKFILVFSGSDSDSAVRRRRTYLATTDPTRRLAFVDIDQRVAGNDPNRPPYTNGDRVFINIQYGSSGWCNLAVSAQAATGFASRIWVLNSETAWDQALSAAVNLLATDKVSNYSWAEVGDAPFRVAPDPGSCGSTQGTP